MKHLILSIVLLSSSSCSFVLKKWGGIKDPKIETQESITKYSKTLTIDSTQITFAKDSACLMEVNKFFLGSPEILIFNNNKKQLPYKADGITCNASIDYTLKNVCSMNSSEIKSNRLVCYDSLISCLADPNNCIGNFDINDVDFIVFFNYARYFDGVNKTHIIPWSKIIKERTIDCKVKYVFVNIDYLKSWGIKKSSLPKYRINLF